MKTVTELLPRALAIAGVLALAGLGAARLPGPWLGIALGAGLVATMAFGFLAGRMRGARELPRIERDIAHLAAGAPCEPWPQDLSAAEHGVALAIERAAEEIERRGRDGVLSKERALFDGRQDALERLAAGIAGRFGQALAGARTSLARLEHGLRPEAPLAENLAESIESLRASIAQATTLMQALRAVAPQQEAPPEPVALEEAVQRAVDERHARAERIGVDLHFEPPPKSLVVRAEPAALAGVVGPLVDNALDVLEGRGGRVAVTATSHPESGAIEIVVEDDGPGLTPSAEGRAFDPFFTTRSGSDGLGLGLVFARAAASKCGGVLTLEPRPGGGVRAVFRLQRPTPRTPSHAGRPDGGRFDAGHADLPRADAGRGQTGSTDPGRPDAQP